MDIGLFGGTFNPIHNGHIGIARHTQKELNLNKIILFPSAAPPHKTSCNLAPARDRLEMIQDSIKGLDGFEASDIELKRKGPSFTIDTIRQFQNLCPDRFFLMMGSDAFFDISTWKNKDQLFKVVPIVVMTRTATKNEAASPPSLSSFIDENISKGYTRIDKRFVHDQMQDIIICNVPRIDISSTMVRDRIKKGLSVKALVPEAACNIMMQRKFYQ